MFSLLRQKLRGCVVSGKEFAVERRFILLWLAGVSLAFVALFNFKLAAVCGEFGYGFASLSFVSAWLMTFASMLAAYAVHWIVLWLLLWIGGVFLFVITWLLRFYGLELNEAIVGATIEAPWHEVMVYVNGVSIALIMVSGGGLFFFVRYLNKHDSTALSQRRERVRSIGLAATIIVVLNAAYYRVAPYNVFMPYPIQTVGFSDAAKFPMRTVIHTMEMVKMYFAETERINEQIANTQDPAQLPSTRTQKEPMTVVVHWGESVRADHLPMNGYDRNTMPRLMQRDIVSFPKVISFATYTRESTLGALSGADFQDRTPVYGGFVSLFNKHGFATYAVVTPQGSLHEVPAFRLLQNTQNIVQIPFKHVFDICQSLPEIREICGGGGAILCSTLTI